MTTIVYHQNKLLGDSRRFENVGTSYGVFYRQKVFLHPSKLFAYGVCGDNLPFHQNIFEDTLKKFVIEYSSNPKFKEVFPYPEIYVLVMMRHITFTIYNNGGVDNQKHLTLHQEDSLIGYGSGAHQALMAIMNGASIEEGIKKAILTDTGTGGNLYGVERNTLLIPPKIIENNREDYIKAFDTMPNIKAEKETQILKKKKRSFLDRIF